ncbi:MAG: hypothetical protein WCX61_00565 [Candidatus Peribacteraceae bacterium]|jgi:hypothetical protein
MAFTTSPDLEVKLKAEKTRAIIEGKTSVPFQTIVSLILQRKIVHLFKRWGTEPVIISSELLTAIASAPQDSQENRAHLIIVTLGVGILAGVFFFTVLQALLLGLGFPMGQRELLSVGGGLIAIAFLASVLGRMQRGNRSQQIADRMEKIASLLSK